MNQNVFAKVPFPLLEAATLCAAKKPDKVARIDSIAIDKGCIVATDSTKLFYCPIRDIKKDLTLAIPIEAVKNFISIVKKDLPKIDHFSIIVTITRDADGYCIQLPPSEIETRFTPIQDYPKWYAALPETDGFDYKGPIPAFDWRHLVEFQKINKILGSRNPLLTHLKPTGENDPAHVYLFGNPFTKAKGILMPLQS